MAGARCDLRTGCRSQSHSSCGPRPPVGGIAASTCVTQARPAGSDERFKQWWSRFERLGASPSAAIALMRMNNEIDIRHILSAIQVPTLVLHRTGDLRVSVEAGRFRVRAFPVLSTSSYPAMITCRGSVTLIGSATRSKSS